MATRTKEARVYATNSVGSIAFVSLTKETLQGALDLLHDAFYTHENVCAAVGLPQDHEAMKELDELVTNTARDGVSIVAVEKTTGAVVGVAFNKLQCKGQNSCAFFENFAAKCKRPAAKAVVDFMAEIDAKCDLFGVLDVDCLLEIMFLATHPDHRGRQVSTKLCETSIEIARGLMRGENLKVGVEGEELGLEPVPKAVSAIFTSFISQRIGEKLSFTKGMIVDYDDLYYEGRKYSSVINPKTKFTTVEYKKL